MTYVILHGKLNEIQGTINDGALVTTFLDKSYSKERKDWDYKKECLQNSEDVFELGNYYSDEEPVEGWDDEGEWNNSKRKFVSEKWVELITLIEESLQKTGRVDIHSTSGRVDIELFNYFTPEKETADVFEDCKFRLRTVIENISRGVIKPESLIKIMSAVEEAGY